MIANKEKDSSQVNWFEYIRATNWGGRRFRWVDEIRLSLETFEHLDTKFGT